MTPAGVAAVCWAIVAYGVIHRITQLVLWILNGQRS